MLACERRPARLRHPMLHTLAHILALQRTMSHTIHHQEQDAKGAFYIAHDGQRLAEMTYSRTNATMIIVDHTEVDPSLSGQGVGRALLGALVE